MASEEKQESEFHVHDHDESLDESSDLDIEHLIKSLLCHKKAFCNMECYEIGSIKQYEVRSKKYAIRMH